jgi:hypothetical protein
MAKVVFGSIVNDARGSIGTNIYTHNRSGPVVRLQSTKTYIHTSGRDYAWSNMLAVRTMWHSTLTQTERNNWNAWATAQNRVHTSLAQTALSGQQWFLKLNRTLYGGTFPINHLPPVNLDVTQPNNLAIVRVKVSTHEFLITYTPFALGADIISWKATKPISPGKTSWLCNIQWFSPGMTTWPCGEPQWPERKSESPATF